MNIKKLIATTGIGMAVIAVPIGLKITGSDNNEKQAPTQIAGQVNFNSEQTYTSSNYLKEKGKLDCQNSCSDINDGYEWAKTNNICNPTYKDGVNEAYNLGVQAWAWDACNYSDESTPI